MSGQSPTRRRPDGAALVMAAFLAALAIIIWTDMARLPQNAGYSGIGAADVPRWIAVALAALAVWTVIAAFREGPQPHSPQAPAPVLWIVLGLVLQILLLKVAGFSIATGLLFACAAAGFGRRNFAITLPVGFLLGLAIYGVFGGILDLSLPSGPVERFLSTLVAGE